MKKNGNEYKNILFLIPYLKQTRYKFLIGIIGMILSSLLVTPIPYLIGYSIDNIILLNKSHIELLKISILMITIYLLGYVMNVIYSYVFSKVQNEVVNLVRISLVRSVLEAPFSFHNKKDKGYILGRISESAGLGVVFSPTFLGTLTGAFDFVFSLFIMFKLSSTLTFSTFIIVPIYFLISRHASKKISDSTTNLYESSAQLNGEVFETLNGIEEIKLLNGINMQISKLKNKLNNMTKNLLRQNLNFVFFVQNLILSNNFVSTFVLFLSGVLILNGDLTLGIYTSFSLYMAKLLGATQAFGSLEVTLKPVCISIRRIKELLEIEKENDNKSTQLNSNIDRIIFEDVSFKYEGNEEFVFQNLNIEIEKEDKILIRGLNGSGKTTLIKLITGLYKPVSGKIYVNGDDYTTIDLESIRDRIGIVSQNIFLFKGTVLDNILFGQRNKTNEDILTVAKKYNLIEYLDKFENGLNTVISQNGFGVSGGQTQVIAFLRAIISERDIIILDEATSNLDILTKEKISLILNAERLCGILIIISHQQEEYQFVNKTIDLNQYSQTLEAKKVSC